MRTEKRIGLNHESILHNRVPLPLVRSFTAMCGEGMPAIYRFVWDRFEPERGQLNTAALYADIRALIDGGAEEITIVRSGVPYWATVDGTPTWHTYEGGCMSLGRTGTPEDLDVPDGEFAAHRPHCAKPTHVSPVELFSIGERIARFITREFTDEARFTFCGGPNEPTQVAYDPFEAMVVRGELSAADEVRFITEEQTFPFVRGARSVIPDARVLWGEFDAGHTVSRFLPAYIASGLIRPGDVYGVHPLAWDEGGTFENAWARGVEMTHQILQHVPDAEVWFTECADRRPVKVPFGERAVFTRRSLGIPSVTRVLWHETDKSFFFLPDGVTPADPDGVRAMTELAAELRGTSNAQDRTRFDALVRADLLRVRNDDLRTLVSMCISGGNDAMTPDDAAAGVARRMQAIDAALAAKKRRAT